MDKFLSRLISINPVRLSRLVSEVLGGSGGTTHLSQMSPFPTVMTNYLLEPAVHLVVRGLPTAIASCSSRSGALSFICRFLHLVDHVLLCMTLLGQCSTLSRFHTLCHLDSSGEVQVCLSQQVPLCAFVPQSTHQSITQCFLEVCSKGTLRSQAT